MVHRRVAQLARPALALALALAATLAAAAPAQADNRRVSIGDFKWSLPDVQIDLGEHVSWYWVGPDTLHSVTGDSPAAAGLDSDPGESQPNHTPGDSFRLDFSTPGIYDFRCKIHASVRGTVEVSSTPGDPLSEVDPVPEVKFDLQPPTISDPYLESPSHRRRPGGKLHFSLDEQAKLEADHYLIENGERTFAGWEKWKNGHIGFNSVRFAHIGKHFEARPGRYVAELRATDADHNTSKPRKIRYRIVPGPKRK